MSSGMAIRSKVQLSTLLQQWDYNLPSDVSKFHEIIQVTLQVFNTLLDYSFWNLHYQYGDMNMSIYLDETITMTRLYNFVQYATDILFVEHIILLQRLSN